MPPLSEPRSGLRVFSDLAAFDEDYRSTPENTQSLPALKFQKRDLEELWGNIKDKLRQIRESPRLTLPEEAESINLNDNNKTSATCQKVLQN